SASTGLRAASLLDQRSSADGAHDERATGSSSERQSNQQLTSHHAGRWATRRFCPIPEHWINATVIPNKNAFQATGKGPTLRLARHTLRRRE
ncbi:MAG: hypothetical protein ACM3U2_02410, partial [Deltaproteobacteria bacterium]